MLLKCAFRSQSEFLYGRVEEQARSRATNSARHRLASDVRARTIVTAGEAASDERTEPAYFIGARPVLLLAVPVLATLALGIFGLGRSLWLDEAWVANSVMAHSLSGMFYYPDWLQTTPPLFLLLTRAAAHVFGPSNVSFRLMALVLAMAGVACMMAVSSRLLSPPLALLATALLAFHPTVIEYSRTCKQYSGEMAAAAAILLCTALYLENPVRRRFYWLAGAFAVTLPLAWSTAFLIPGAAIAVCARGGVRRAACLVLIACGVLGILYLAFVRPNLSPQLREFWMANAQSLSPGLLAALVFCIAAAVRAVLIRAWMQLAALLPCVLLAASDALHWYPASPRTRLFALPCFLLAAAMVANDMWPWRRLTAVAWLVVIAIGSTAAWNQVRQHRNRPEEDFAGAVQYLRQHVAPSDLLLVHASVIEGFKLYWPHNHAIYGSTGWPCCERNRQARVSGVDAVFADLDRKIPKGFSGRVWLFYSTRNTHWTWVGLDEGTIWRSHVWQKGCPPGPYLAFANLAVSPMDCVRTRQPGGKRRFLPAGPSQ